MVASVLTGGVSIVLAMTIVNARRTAAGTSYDAAFMALYDVVSARHIESGEISFTSISDAASRYIEAWARQLDVPSEKYLFAPRG
jgi:hypothetical protein